MKQKSSVLSLFICVTSLQASEYPIKLDSLVIKIVDGSFITADRIEFISKLRRNLLTIILGELLPNGQRCGSGIQTLALLEKELATQPKNSDNISKQMELDEKLELAKANFIGLSHEFIQSGRGAKNILIILIQEYCQKRNRNDSLLLEWAKTKEGAETIMFEERVTSFNSYYHFCTDLVNFLLDLIHSCPKAENQFKERVKKWAAVKKILPVIIKKAHIKVESFNEMEFLKYLKERYLNKIILDEITPQIILPLLTEYIKHTS